MANGTITNKQVAEPTRIPVTVYEEVTNQAVEVITIWEGKKVRYELLTKITDFVKEGNKLYRVSKW